MSPRDWRSAQSLTLDAVAAMLGLEGKGRARQYQRYELGQVQVPTEVVASIEEASQGAVTANDWHRVRLDHLGRAA